jgi:Autotransporter beta-domain
MKHPQHTVLAGLALLAAAPLHAEEWKHELAPYLWGSAMEGTTGIGGVTADVDVSFGDILDNLEMGFMGMYRGTRDRFSISVDTIFMGLGATQRSRNDLAKADIDVDQFVLGAAAGYALTEKFLVLGGLRYNDLSAEVKVTGPLGNTADAETDESWVDPYLGAQYTIPLSDAWSLNLYGDIGGFGIGSDLAWQGLVTFRWQLTERTGALAAYRYMDVDYESGSGSDRFKYDMAFSGPALGIVFTF